MLFEFGAVGTLCWVWNGNASQNKFDAQSMLGIALGRSEFTNGDVIFCDPEIDSFCALADCVLDTKKQLDKAFPVVDCDGGLLLNSNLTI